MTGPYQGEILESKPAAPPRPARKFKPPKFVPPPESPLPRKPPVPEEVAAAADAAVAALGAELADVVAVLNDQVVKAVADATDAVLGETPPDHG